MHRHELLARRSAKARWPDAKQPGPAGDSDTSGRWGFRRSLAATSRSRTPWTRRPSRSSASSCGSSSRMETRWVGASGSTSTMRTAGMTWNGRSSSGGQHQVIAGRAGASDHLRPEDAASRRRHHVLRAHRAGSDAARDQRGRRRSRDGVGSAGRRSHAGGGRWRTIARPRAISVLVGVFALVALALAAVGVYGVMAYSVRQRTQEIGVRMALGASAGSVLRLVLGQALRLVATGVAIGLVAAGLLTRLLERLLYEVEPLDPWTFAVTAIVLLLVAIIASCCQHAAACTSSRSRRSGRINGARSTGPIGFS